MLKFGLFFVLFICINMISSTPAGDLVHPSGYTVEDNECVDCIVAISKCVACTGLCYPNPLNFGCGCCVLNNCPAVYNACAPCMSNCFGENQVLLDTVGVNAVGAGTQYQLNLNFCNLNDYNLYQSLNSNIIVTKDISGTVSSVMHTAWQSYTPNNIYQKNNIAWQEIYGLLATSQLLSDNVIVTGTTEQLPANAGVYYDLNGFFRETSDRCEPGKYGARNKQGDPNVQIGLFQDVKGSQAVLGLFPVGLQGSIQMDPKLSLTVFLGYWSQSAVIDSTVYYPMTTVILTASNPVATLNFDPLNNQFVTAPCP